MTREQWLEKAVTKLQTSIFAGHAEIPKVRVSVGFPGGKSARKTVGQYWHASSIEDKVPQIFISPVLKTSFDHLDTLVHELVHACTPGAGHRGPFKKLALKIGLEGPMRSAAAGPELKERLNTLCTELGEFPHAGINLSDRKKQTTRMIKLECVCGFICRASRKAIEEVGPPTCACGETMELEEN